MYTPKRSMFIPHEAFNENSDIKTVLPLDSYREYVGQTFDATGKYF